MYQIHVVTQSFPGDKVSPVRNKAGKPALLFLVTQEQAAALTAAYHGASKGPRTNPRLFFTFYPAISYLFSQLWFPTVQEVLHAD
jgi:hypothetical protein